MRILVLTQGASFGVFRELMAEVTDPSTVAYFVADRQNYERQSGTGGADAFTILKEWELVAAGRKRRPNPGELREWEERLGTPTLWPAVLADRRMIYGPLAKVRQDYQPALTRTEMQGVVLELAEALWDAVDRLSPDLVLGFVPVTTGEYIGHLVARARGIPYLHLKSTKIENFVTLSPTIREEHPHIRRRFDKYMAAGGDARDEWLEAADDYLRAAEAGPLSYEGTLKRQKQPGVADGLARFLVHLPGLLKEKLQMAATAGETDPQRLPPLAAAWSRHVGRPRRAAAARRMVRDRLITVHEMAEHPEDHVFFPLNSEPEIALSVYAPFHLNQIEVVRNVAQSVSMSTTVVVKEHPRSWGLRSPGYYNRLLEIPNVRILPVSEPTVAGIRASRTTLAISGFAVFEGVLQRRAVTTFGATPFDMLPSELVRRVAAPEELAQALGRNAPPPELASRALRCFVAAVMRESIRLDLYTMLLGKPGRVHVGGGSDDRSVQLGNLATYLRRRAAEEGIG